MKRSAIAGVGIDLVEIERIRWLYRRWGNGFAARILSREELREAGKPARRGEGRGGTERPWAVSEAERLVRFLAGRFAAKEAVLKALGTGISGGIRWQDITIVRESGRPIAHLSGKAARLAHRMGVRAAHVSISHTRTHAAAAAVAERAG